LLCGTRGQEDKRRTRGGRIFSLKNLPDQLLQPEEKQIRQEKALFKRHNQIKEEILFSNRRGNLSLQGEPVFFVNRYDTIAMNLFEILKLGKVIPCGIKYLRIEKIPLDKSQREIFYHQRK
jgi:hypothetical protein